MNNKSFSGGNRGSSQNSGRDKCLSGYQGAICTQNEVLHATSAWNSTNDTVGWGSQVSGMISALRGNVRYECIAENITGPARCNASGINKK